MADIKTAIDGTELWYESDKWHFELRGKEESAETLSQAREIIRTPAQKEKSTFSRIEAFCYGYGMDGRERVIVTRIAENSRYDSGVQLWVSSKKGRSKTGSRSVFPATPENTAIVEDLKTLDQALASCQKRIKETEARLTPYEPL